MLLLEHQANGHESYKMTRCHSLMLQMKTIGLLIHLLYRSHQGRVLELKQAMVLAQELEIIQTQMVVLVPEVAMVLHLQLRARRIKA